MDCFFSEPEIRSRVFGHYPYAGLFHFADMVNTNSDMGNTVVGLEQISAEGNRDLNGRNSNKAVDAGLEARLLNNGSR